MVCESHADVEGELLSRLRTIPALRTVPLGGILDLHANFSAAMARHSQALLAYRENPHADACAMAGAAVELLDAVIGRNAAARTVHRHLPILWPPTGTGTAEDPLRTLEAMARQIERANPDIPAVNVWAGFALADTPEAGLNFSAIATGDPQTAERHLDELGRWAMAHKEDGNKTGMSPEDAMAKLKGLPPGLIVLTEPSDNIGAGAPGDGTGLLRVVVRHGIQDTLVAINDPAAVREISSKPRGSRQRLSIGGKGSRLDAGPLVLEVEFISASDGHFTLENPQSHLASMCGSRIDMGPCAVVRHEGTWILLTSRATPPFDLGQFHSQGLYPERMRVAVVKAAVAHRSAYDPIARASLAVETAGPCSSNLRALEYRKVRRPVFPLDPIQ